MSWQDGQGGTDEACALLECHVLAACRSVDPEFRRFCCVFYDSVVRTMSLLLHRYCGKKWQGSEAHHQILISDVHEAKHRGMWARGVLESVLQTTQREHCESNSAVAALHQIASRGTKAASSGHSGSHKGLRQQRRFLCVSQSSQVVLC